MRFDIVTIFPRFFDGPLDYGIVRRALETGLIEVEVHDLREFTHDRHRTVDDRPFGGGEGMVLKAEPLFEAVESLVGGTTEKSSSMSPGSTAIVLLSASGKPFRHETAFDFSELERIVLLCGRYEGVDERVAERLATEEIAVGDVVLSGGELPAAMIADAVTRLLPGALGNELSALHESFSDTGHLDQAATGGRWSESAQRSEGPPHSKEDTRRLRIADLLSRASHESEVTGYPVLDWPHYTRPAEFRGWAVPEVLMSGNHEQIRRWRRKMALAKTVGNRPDLLAGARLSPEDRRLLEELRHEADTKK